MFCHVLLSGGIYALLTIARAPSVWNVRVSKTLRECLAEIEPRISANLSNQFEWPVFFHVVCLLLILTQDTVERIQVVLAWTFIAGRICHSALQILTPNIRARGLVFTINFLAVIAMWIRLMFEI
ncbi:MAG: MAPEG family protein [Pseudomonadota bacterium]